MMQRDQATLVLTLVGVLTEKDRIKSLPTHHTISTIQVVEDIKTLSTHHIPSPPGPINGDVTISTVEQEAPMNLETPKK